MKNHFKNTIAGYLMALSLAFVQVSCSNQKTTETTETTTTTTTSKGDAAYTDYKNYVSTIDTTATASADSSWAEQRRLYDEKAALLDQYNNDYDDARRQEIDQMKSRYSTYWNSHATTHNGGMAPDKVSHTTTKDMMAAFDPATITATTPLAIRQAYESFVANVQAHKEAFRKEDWAKVSAYNKALDDRKNSMQSQLSDKDKYEIGKAKAKYTALKAGEKLDPDMSKAASDVGEAGNKVGHAAKETGKDVKNAAVKGAKAVGHTADKAGEKVKDVFDGKDKE